MNLSIIFSGISVICAFIAIILAIQSKKYAKLAQHALDKSQEALRLANQNKSRLPLKEIEKF